MKRLGPASGLIVALVALAGCGDDTGIGASGGQGGAAGGGGAGNGGEAAGGGGAAAGGESAGGGGAAPFCSPGLTQCGEECFDTDVDPTHCGDCVTACEAGQVCDGSGQCALTCQAGLIDCGGTCTDPLTSNAFCGASGDCAGANAGEACEAGEICSAGACALSCQAGLIDCGGVCTDPLTSNAFCGASGDCAGANAGATCDAGEVCSAGTCALSCQAGLIDCGGTCVDPLTSNAFCGATGDCAGANAGDTCDAGEVCSAGTCDLSCQAGLVECNGQCIDPLTSNAFCGATGDCQGGNAGDSCDAGEVCSAGTCELSCQAGLLECNGQCIDPLTSNAYCGASGDCQGANDGTACGAGAACSNGACEVLCGQGQTNCSDVCVDMVTDENNCGGCGVVCGAAQTCIGGDCQAVSCAPGAVAESTSPSGDMIVCDDPTNVTCEENFESLCGPGLQLCTYQQYTARNTGWTYAVNGGNVVLGEIYCRSSGSAGHFTMGPYDSIANLGQDIPLNCGYGSSRPSCPSGFGCNEQSAKALCCAPTPSCGNGVVDSAEEQCDDGNASESDTCLNNCTLRTPGAGAGLGCG